MALFESSGSEQFGGEADSAYIDLPFPENADDFNLGWTELFNSVYGDGTLSTTISADRCFRERLDSRGCRVPGTKSFDAIRFDIDEDETVFLSGKVVRLVMMHEDEERGRYYPHAILKEVELVNGFEPISQTKQQEFMVPLAHIDRLILYH